MQLWNVIKVDPKTAPNLRWQINIKQIIVLWFLFLSFPYIFLSGLKKPIKIFLVYGHNYLFSDLIGFSIFYNVPPYEKEILCINYKKYWISVSHVVFWSLMMTNSGWQYFTFFYTSVITILFFLNNVFTGYTVWLVSLCKEKFIISKIHCFHTWYGNNLRQEIGACPFY